MRNRTGRGVEGTPAVNLVAYFSWRKEEAPMFQMIDEERPSAEDRKMVWMKVGLFIVLVAALGGVVYFFAFVPWAK